MAAKKAGDSLDSLVSGFNARIAELQELVIARNMYPATSVADLSAVDAALKAMELQVQGIKDRVREETLAIPKAKKLINASLQQQKKLQNMSVYVATHVPERALMPSLESNRLEPGLEASDRVVSFGCLKLKEEPAAPPKEKKGRSPPPLWYISDEELDSLSSYMRGRLTLEKVNAAINDMATYAEANAQILAAPKKKLTENLWDKALVIKPKLELRDIASSEVVKGKHFFLEGDLRGPALKLDNTGKAILTVLRHLGRITESRIGHHRVIILLNPQQ